MQCPGCKGSLRREKVQYVEFGICMDCRGIWVSGEQFRSLAVKVAADGQVESSAKLSFEPRKVLRMLPECEAIARECPQCHVAMKEFNYAYDSNVFLDRCEQCKGIWLDPNEIVDIAAHIQYNPQLDAVGKGLIHKCDLDNAGGEEQEGIWCAAGIVLAILQALIFRR